MSKKISIKQFLMKTGKFERRYDCIAAARSGKVTINGKSVINPNYFFNAENSLVKVENEKIKQIQKLYFLLNKPAGYLSQKSQGEKTIYDLFQSSNLPKEAIRSLHAVGRLDKDTEGLLIVTNDGKLSGIIINPENEIPKKYYAILEKTIDRDKIKMLEQGIEINIDNEPYTTKPCKIKLAGKKEAYISISEGRKRQIRLMFEAIGNKILYLKRVSIAGLQLGNLKVGEIKTISREEIYSKLDIQQRL